MKKKIVGILALSLLFSSCAIKGDTYVSKRHQEENPVNEQAEEPSTEIRYTEGSQESKDSENQETTENQEATENQDTSENEDSENNENVDDVEYLTANTLNMRYGPSTSSGVVVEVPGGETVIKIGQNGEWTRATYEGYTGYILTELLTPVE